MPNTSQQYDIYRRNSEQYSIKSEFLSRKYFALSITAIVFDNLDLIIPICSFQSSLSSIKIPKNLVTYTLSKFVLVTFMSIFVFYNSCQTTYSLY